VGKKKKRLESMEEEEESTLLTPPPLIGCPREAELVKSNIFYIYSVLATKK
jgi:hypothetical protein